MPLTRDSHDLAVRPRLNVMWIPAVVGAALWLIFELDRRTGSAPVQHLYYLPIILASLRMGAGTGLVVSTIAVVLYHLANLAHFTAMYADTDVVQTFLFVVVGIVTAKLSADARRLRQLAMTDDLTGLHNLRSFEAHLERMIRTSRQTRTPLGMLVLDVDRLKSINDTYGHRAGAEAVRLVGHTLPDQLPVDAVACRYGGDEFAIAIPNCGRTVARRYAEELRGAVYALAPVLAGRSFAAGALSISVGFACLDDDNWLTPDSPKDRGADLLGPRGDLSGPRDDGGIGARLFDVADDALYIAKQQGRNRVGALAPPA